jgi:hypothetical protein
MSLKSDIEKFKNGIKRDLIQQKRLAARMTLRKLLNRSPARSGSYMKSHNVGISKTETGRGIGKSHAKVHIGKPFLPEMNNAERLSLAAQLYAQKNGYISAARLNDSITIYNVIPYANQVEYLGWVKTPAHHVYGLTVAEMQIIMPLLPKMVSGDINI